MEARKQISIPALTDLEAKKVEWALRRLAAISGAYSVTIQFGPEFIHNFDVHLHFKSAGPMHGAGEDFNESVSNALADCNKKSNLID